MNATEESTLTAMPTTAAQNSRKDRPILADKAITFIPNWEAWLEAWRTTDCAEALLGLLYVGFEIPQPYNACERICFYLDLADGNGLQEASFADNPRDEQQKHNTSFDVDRQKMTIGAIRKALAQKALSVLCKHYFGLKRTEREYNPNPAWIELVLNEAVFEKTLWFFQVISDEWGPGNRIKNGTTSDKRQSEVIKDFLCSFCELFWKFKQLDPDRERESDRQHIEKFRLNRQRIIPLMDQLGILNLLLRYPSTDQDDKVVNALTKIVMSESSYFPGESSMRSPKNPEEALLGGRGQVASVILNALLTMKKARKRLRRNHDLQGKRNRAAQQVEVLDEKLRKAV